MAKDHGLAFVGLSACVSGKGNGMNQEYFDRYTESVYSRVNALTPEELERSAVEYACVYQGLLPSNRSLPVLDIGCGGGSFLYFLKNSGVTKPNFARK